MYGGLGFVDNSRGRSAARSTLLTGGMAQPSVKDWSGAVRAAERECMAIVPAGLAAKGGERGGDAVACADKHQT